MGFAHCKVLLPMLTRSTLATCLALLAGALPSPAAPTAKEIIEKVVTQEDANFEEAKNWEYTQHFVIQKLFCHKTTEILPFHV